VKELRLWGNEGEYEEKEEGGKEGGGSRERLLLLFTNKLGLYNPNMV
jgi:hypothetical protein